ncbi:olfactory receptor 49-like [Oryzias melastigma]|uniref:olfactory receptor 49-like n=1 Tax=Oryzias melastigma TaxID=30732 RepID=UPI000CF7C657|nr:olfactory receptor 49-like [Oryzias melastigma]
MELKYNVSLITLDGFIQIEKYRVLYFLIVFTVFILILLCNCTIVFIIVAKKSLHEPMYIFIAALLTNSLMFSAAVYPKLLVDILSKRQTITYYTCFFQHGVYYSLGASEFLLLTAMSFDRYVSICKPLQYPSLMSKRRVTAMLMLSWLWPLLQLMVAISGKVIINQRPCSFSLEAIFCNTELQKLLCIKLEEFAVLDMMILINVALLPALFILFTYIRILIISYQSSKEIRSRAAQTCLPHVLVLVNFSCLGSFEVIIGFFGSGYPKALRLTVMLQIIIYQPLFNPTIYGLKMKQISRHVKMLFCPDKKSQVII